MSKFHVLLLVSAFVIFQSCASSKTFWVAGVKTTCSAGAGQGSCLLVNENDDPNMGNWTNMYTTINDFNFEPGNMKKVKVRTKKLKDVPADASSVSYFLIKELEKRTDPRNDVQGKWTLVKLNGNLINRSIVIPTLEISVENHMISGNAGCNRYSGGFLTLGTSQFSLKPIVQTKMACLQNNNLEDEYLQKLQSVTSYAIKDGQLNLMDANNIAVLTFIK